MIAKMKVKFIPRDYQITLFRRMQNLRQKLMTVKEYTEEFYRLNIRAGHQESDDEKVARYLNGLRYDIHDELNMVTMLISSWMSYLRPFMYLATFSSSLSR